VDDLKKCYIIGKDFSEEMIFVILLARFYK